VHHKYSSKAAPPVQQSSSSKAVAPVHIYT
jgi:hypothetical protein